MSKYLYVWAISSVKRVNYLLSQISYTNCQSMPTYQSNNRLWRRKRKRKWRRPPLPTFREVPRLVRGISAAFCWPSISITQRILRVAIRWRNLSTIRTRADVFNNDDVSATAVQHRLPLEQQPVGLPIVAALAAALRLRPNVRRTQPIWKQITMVTSWNPAGRQAGAEAGALLVSPRPCQVTTLDAAWKIWETRLSDIYIDSLAWRWHANGQR